MPTDDQRLFPQLGMLLRMAGAHPRNWIGATVSMSVTLAALDTLGVAAMIPLTQLIAGTPADSGVLGVIAGVVGTSDPATLVPVVAITVAMFFIIKSVLSILFRWWLLGRTTRVGALAATDLLRRYVLSPYSAHRTRRMNVIYRNITDSTGQAASVLLAVVGIATDLLVLAAIVTVLAFAAPLVTLIVTIVFGAFVFGLQRLLRGRQSRIGEELAEASLEAWQYLLPGLDGFREARLTASASTFVDGYRRAKLRTARALREMSIVSEAPRYALEVGFVLSILGLSLALFATSTPANTITVLGVFAAASLRALPTLNRVAGSLATIRSGRVGLRIVLRVVGELGRHDVHIEAPSGAVDYSGDIDIRGVSFAYPDTEELVLDDVTLRIPVDTTVAFVGASGAGKSTLMDLVLGLLEPLRGTIECGGKDILQDRAAWYAGLGVVPQDVFLVNDTIAANVAFGQPRDLIDDSRVIEVMELAQLRPLLDDLPDGLQTMVGERGVRLSGGQRQRLGLARALYRQPAVLVLDEATSALDNETEHEIAKTLHALSGSLTIVIVAHRLSTVRNADSIVFLKGGRVETQGTFDVLRRASTDFARLVELGELS